MKIMQSVKTMSRLFSFLLISLFCMLGTGCCDNENNTETNPGKDKPIEETAFAKGADVGWLTEMEAKGIKFYNEKGGEQECMSLLKDLGMNSIRLRVWVNPDGGWNGKEDVLKKALRAKTLGMCLMIDFHYADSWADPGKPPIPKAWKGHTIDQLCNDVSAHTKDVLQLLKDNDIAVEWVQVGNETNQGMLWDKSEIAVDNGFVQHQQFGNFVRLVNAGYDAVKSVYPNAKVIVHTSNGHDRSLFTWMYDGLKANGAKYDVIGMSLYPEQDNWQETTRQCVSNISYCISRYDKPVMVAEVGMPWDSPHASAFLKQIVSGAKAIDRCLGVFYWEPQCHNNWQGYNKGAFDNSGRPTSALDAFSN